MDGTLADTAKVTIPACAEVAGRLGLPRLSNEIIIGAIGFANPEFYFRLYPDLDSERVLAFGRAVERVEESFVRTIGDEILFPGVKELLDALYARRIPMHIASTGDQNHVDAVLRSADIERFFTTIACGAPQKAAMVADIIGANDPAAFAMVGDREHDVHAARSNGILAIAALYGYCRDAAPFDRALNTPIELLQWV
ncbi:MAG: HAD family hydrolase [Clostridia bacterium]|nr:HAD family hydrolase [Clostridia bacterium]